MRIPGYGAAGWVPKKKREWKQRDEGLTAEGAELGGGGGVTAGGAQAEVVPPVACGAVLGSPLLLPLAILRCEPSPSPAAAIGSSIRFSRGDRRRATERRSGSAEAEPRREASPRRGLQA